MTDTNLAGAKAPLSQKIGYGFGDEPIVISKKFYNLIIKELKDNPKHFIFYPIA